MQLRRRLDGSLTVGLMSMTSRTSRIHESEGDAVKVQLAFAAAMKPYGFQKNRLRWHICPKSSITSSIELQSVWHTRKGEGLHFVNFYVLLHELDFERSFNGQLASSLRCHVWCRAEELCGVPRLDEILDDDIAISPVARHNAINQLVNDNLVPIGRRLATVDGLLQIYESGSISYVFKAIKTLPPYLLFAVGRKTEALHLIEKSLEELESNSSVDPPFLQHKGRYVHGLRKLREMFSPVP
jgi:hypothetical protein